MRSRLVKRVATALVLFIAVLALPLALPSTASAAAPICSLSGDMIPQTVGTGLGGMLTAAPTAEQTAAGLPMTNYDRYGMSGLFWHTHDLSCTDFTTVLGNMWANMIFDVAKAVDQLTIATYQSAMTEGPLQSIKNVVDDIVTNLSTAVYWPFLRPLVILGAIWLAWYGLIRKRATTTAEGVIWMVLAVTVAVWFFSRPGDFTNVGKVITDKTGQVVNSAFAGLPGSSSGSCLPAKGVNSPTVQGGYGQPGTPGVAQTSDALWSTLVCKPWLMGQFGTADPSANVVRDFGGKLLDAQAYDRAEQTAGVQTVAAAQAESTKMADLLRNTAVWPVYSGADASNRIGVAFLALLAAMMAGLLIFLVSVTLLVLKVGFLLLLILGPIFLLIGVHPGSGRIIAMRWVEMLIGTLLRQAVLTLVLGLLVYGYSLIISTAMPWGMQILFMALLTMAVFFYRRPFSHLFASMNGHTLATRMLGDAASSPMLERAGGALPPIATQRLGRWGMRKAEPVVGAMTVGAATGAAAGVGASVAQGRMRGAAEDVGAGAGSGARVPVQAAPLNTDATGVKPGSRPVTPPRTGAAPPLNLNRVRPATAGAGAPAPSPAAAAGGTRSAWFGGRSGGGWASRGGSSGARDGVSGGGTRSRGSGGGLFGGASGASGSGGGGLFGGSSGSGSRNGSSGSRGGSGSGSSGSRGASGSGSSGSRGGSGSSGGAAQRGGPAPRHADVPQARSAEPPPLWLPARRSDSGGAEGSSAPFWLRPSRSDKD